MKVFAFTTILPLILLISNCVQSGKIPNNEQKNLRVLQQSVRNPNRKTLQKRGVLLGNAFTSNQGLNVWPKVYADHYGGYNLNTAVAVASNSHLIPYKGLQYKPVTQLAVALPATYVFRPESSISQGYSVNYPHQHFRPNVNIKPIHSLAALTPVHTIHPLQAASNFQNFQAIPAEFRPPGPDCHAAVLPPPQQATHVLQTAYVPAHVAHIAPQPTIPQIQLIPFAPAGAQAAPAAPALPAIPAFPTLPNFPNIPDVPNIPNIPNIPAIPNIPNIPNIPQAPTPANAFIPISFQPPLVQKPPTFVTSSGNLVPVATKPDPIASEASRPFATPSPAHPVPLQPPFHTPSSSYGPPSASSHRPFHTLQPPYSHNANEGHIPPAANQHQSQPFHSESNSYDNFGREQIQQHHHQQQQQIFLQNQADQQQLNQQTEHYQLHNYQTQY